MTLNYKCHTKILISVIKSVFAAISPFHPSSAKVMGSSPAMILQSVSAKCEV